MLTDPKTGTQYRSRAEAQVAMKQLAPDLVEPTTAPMPATAPGQVAIRNAFPTQQPDGTWQYEWTIEQITVTPDMVDAERDRRIGAGFVWNGHTFQSDPGSLDNIAGAGAAATAFVVGGGAPTEIYWYSPSRPFVWLDADNVPVQMTPADVMDFGRTAMAHKAAHIYAARALKDMATIPQDYTSDTYWP